LGRNRIARHHRFAAADRKLRRLDVAEAAARLGAHAHGHRPAVESDRRAGILGDRPNARIAVGTDLDPLRQDFRLGVLRRRKTQQGGRNGGEAQGAADGHLGIPPIENLEARTNRAI
jgi:hypothetical protein